MRNRTLVFTTTMTALALAAAPGWAAEDHRQAKSADGEWVSITDRVGFKIGSDFVLDYGGGDITVETDDYGLCERNAVLPGERVTVAGRKDDDFYDRRTIEAISVILLSPS